MTEVLVSFDMSPDSYVLHEPTLVPRISKLSIYITLGLYITYSCEWKLVHLVERLLSTQKAGFKSRAGSDTKDFKN